jgi:phosphotransferase system, enzyme I, PtsP
VILRTLDIGGDKMLSYFPTIRENNPFLGLRAIRFSLRHRDIFEQQIKAMLRAGYGTALKIMFPLISSVDDFIQAREVVNGCRNALRSAGVDYNDTPELGLMIELPSAVEVVEELAQEADFLSIGSNDLVQYVLAVDRTNEYISDLYIPYHPAVLRSLKRISKAAEKHNREVCLCGELAADKKIIFFLIGIGIRKMSVDARNIQEVQAVVASIDSKKAQQAAEQMLKMGRINEIEDFIKKSEFTIRTELPRLDESSWQRSR